MIKKEITLPLTEKVISDLHIGDLVLISGDILTARDAVHKLFYNDILDNKNLKINIKGQVIYYVGPTPAKPGNIIGSAGPTSSYRMDFCTPNLLDLGLKGIIGKGDRNDDVIKSIKDNKAVYFAAIGGVAALISKSIIKKEIICYKELGTEAVHKLTVKNFPAIVAIDSYGYDIYRQAYK